MTRPWDPATDIPWPPRPSGLPPGWGSSPIPPFEFLAPSRPWRRLRPAARRRLQLELLDWTICQLISGERLARDICRQAQKRAPCPLLLRQESDERRHLKAFRLYRARVLGRAAALPYPDGYPALSRLLRRERGSRRALTALRAVGEPLFEFLLARLRRAAPDAALARLLDLIVSDEARHRRGAAGPDSRAAAPDAGFLLRATRAAIGPFPDSVWRRAGLDPEPFRLAPRVRTPGRGPFAGLVRSLRAAGLAPARLRPHYAALESL